MSIPSDASSANCDSTADDPKLALTVDLKDLIDSYNSLLADLRTRNLDAPTGTVAAFAGASAPTGWLLCDGSAVSRTTYAALFAVVGTTYGAGDGTTFNLPDLRGRAPFGKDNMGGSAASRITASSGITGTTLGAAGGSQLSQSHSHTGTTAGQSNDHTHSGTTSSDGGHTHTVGVTTVSGTDGATSGIQQTAGGTGAGPTQTDTTSTAGAHTHTITTGGISAGHTHTFSTSTAGSGGSENMPPAIILNYIVKT